MNREIDSENSPEESLRLKKYLDSNPADAQYFQELQQAHLMIGEVEDLEFPAYSREQLFEKIREIDRRKRSGISNVISSTRENLRVIWGRRQLCGFAVGMAVGIIAAFALFYFYGNPEQDDLSNYYGSLVSSKYRDLSPLGSYQFEEKEISGSIRTSAHGNRELLVFIHLSSPAQNRILIEFEDSAIFKGITASEKADFGLHKDKESIEIAHSGEAEYLLAFASDSPEDQSITMKIFSENRLLVNKKISGGN